MNKADGKKIGARARREIVREVEASQAATLIATCDLLDYLMASEPSALDAWHALGKVTAAQIRGIEHYLATRERFAEDPAWIERLREVVQRYYRERVRAERGWRRARPAEADQSTFVLE